MNYLLLRDLLKNIAITKNLPNIKVSPPSGVTNHIDFTIIDVK